jgi:predicted ABC-type ATPase
MRDLVATALDQARAQLAQGLETCATLNSLLGQVDTYTGSNDLQRESSGMDFALAKARLREDADLRAQLARQGMEPEKLDAMGLHSHDELDMMEADGTIEEAAFGLAAHFHEWMVRRGRGGEFADKPGAIKPPHLKGPGGKSAPGAPSLTLKKPGGGAPSAPAYKVPQEPPKAPQSPGTAEAVKHIKSLSDVQQQLKEVAQHGLNDWPEKGEIAQRLFGAAADSREFHTRPVPASPGTEGGEGKRSYTASRKAVHDAIIGDFLAGPVGKLLGDDHAITQKLKSGGVMDDSEKQAVRDAAKAARGGGRPQALFMAGGPASGKTSALNAAPELNPDASVVINPDEMKDRLPEYRQMIEGGDRFAASGVHEESSDLGKRLQNEAIDLGLNTVVDGTGDSKKGKFTGKMQDMDKAGYDVSALYVTIPTDQAVVRATARAMKSGRWVPEPEIRAQHKNVSANFPDVAGLPFLKGLKLYDNSGDGDPVLIGEAAKGKLTVHNADAYRAFMDKAKEAA